MKVSILTVYILLLALIVSFSSCRSHDNINNLHYVNMLIGTAYPSHISTERGQDYIFGGQNIPAVAPPFAMTQWTIQTESNENRGVAPFYSGKIRFEGFRATHWLNGSSYSDYGSFTFFPAELKNNYRFLPRQRESMFMYNTNTSTPAYISVLMPEQNIITEITATKRSAIFKFSWLYPKLPTIIVDINNDYGKGFIKVDVEKQEIYGYNPVYTLKNGEAEYSGTAGYFVAKFNKKFSKFGTYSGMNYESGTAERTDQKQIGAYVTFDNAGNSVVLMKTGTSFTSIENARKNLETEIKGWDFNETKTKLENEWNNVLGRIDVSSNDTTELTKLYTSLYHCFLQPRLYSDVNGNYPGFATDSAIHTASGFDYYGDFAAWNSYRAQMPLLSLLAPKEYNDMIKSLIVKAEQGGQLPAISLHNSYVSPAKGDYCTTIITDAFMKGFEFDINKAYKYMRKSAFENDSTQRISPESYIEFGYIPLDNDSDNITGQVTQTLNYSYNDWCIALTAKKLGKNEDYNELNARALNYLNVYDAGKFTVCGRYADETFTDYYSADNLMPYLTEGTPRQYTFFVPHDIKGLIELTGGEKEFGRKLDFIVGRKKLWPGNEPSMIIPYLYNSVNEWDKTQITVKNILKKNYSLTTNGYKRNDIAGELSAWYVFGAIGFYPVCPGSNKYELSSPVFEKVTLNLDENYYHGKQFIIETGAGQENNTFNKVELNGKEIKPFITHSDIQKGGKLFFSNR